jgi:hypothetical protein
MTLLTHTGRPFERASAKRRPTGVTNAHLAMIKRVCLIALTFLLALCAVSGIIVFEGGGLSLALYPLTHWLNSGCTPRRHRRKPRLH